MQYFVQMLYERLSEKLPLELAGNEIVFLDEERLKTGDILDGEISAALCQSVCFLVIYTRSYLSADHPYCARELYAFLELEKKRKTALGNENLGLVLSIILSGKRDEIPDILSANRIYTTKFQEFKKIGFRYFTTAQRRRFETEVSNLTELIAERVRILERYSQNDCKDFQLLDAEEERIQDFIKSGNIDFEDIKDQFPK